MVKNVNHGGHSLIVAMVTRMFLNACELKFQLKNDAKIEEFTTLFLKSN